MPTTGVDVMDIVKVLKRGRTKLVRAERMQRVVGSDHAASHEAGQVALSYAIGTMYMAGQYYYLLRRRSNYVKQLIASFNFAKPVELL